MGDIFVFLTKQVFENQQIPPCNAFCLQKLFEASINRQFQTHSRKQDIRNPLAYKNSKNISQFLLSIEIVKPFQNKSCL